jgi:outer membrane lipoprotein-sorting protein
MKAAPLVVFIAAFLFGCASRRENLPAVHFRDDREALDILVRRADAVRTVSSQGTITLQRPSGESVRLDLAMVRAGREKLRLRAWKLGRAAFDLTMNGDEVWLFTPEDPSLKSKARSAGLTAKQLAENFNLLSGKWFHRPNVKVLDGGAKLIISSAQGGALVRCEVDRRTVTPRKYVMVDSGGVARFTLELSDYRLLDGDVPFPFRYIATSDEGKITIALREVELNGELAEGAFVPPKRAEKLK